MTLEETRMNTYARQQIELIERIEQLEAENARLMVLCTKLDGMLSKRPCQNNRCLERNRLEDALCIAKLQVADRNELDERVAQLEAVLRETKETLMHYQYGGSSYKQQADEAIAKINETLGGE